MDQLFQDIIGKTILNSPAVITVVAENFSLVGEEALFLRSVLGIPEVKNLPFTAENKALFQINRTHLKVKEQLNKLEWVHKEYITNIHDNLIERIELDLSRLPERSVIFINDVAKLEILNNSTSDLNKFILFITKLKHSKGHFFVLLYQNSDITSQSTFLKHINYLSDAVVRVTSDRLAYFKSIWWQTVPFTKTLVPPRVATKYCLSKICQSHESTKLVCFQETKPVAQDYDFKTDMSLKDEEQGTSRGSLEKYDKLSDDDDDSYEDGDARLPFAKARNPEESRIFYYPDKEDDVDEDDPDSDLTI